MALPCLIWLEGSAQFERLARFGGDQGLLMPEEMALPLPRRATRSLLRLILAEQPVRTGTGEPLRRRPVAFRSRPHGKPELAASTPLAFSFSYAGEAAIIALTWTGPIGVDLEAPRKITLSPQRRMALCTNARDAGLIATAEASVALQDDVAFLKVWTRLEALAKARGDGIGAVLEELGVRPAPKGGARSGTKPSTGIVRGLELRLVEVPAPWQAAVATPPDTPQPCLIRADEVIEPAISNWLG